MPMVTEQVVREISEDQASNYVKSKLDDTHRSAKKKDFTAVIANSMEVIDTLAQIGRRLTNLDMSRVVKQVRTHFSDPDLGNDPAEPDWKTAARDLSDAVKLWKQFDEKAHKSHVVRVLGEVMSAIADVLMAMKKRKAWVAGRDLSGLAAELHIKAVKLAKEAGHAAE